MAVGIVQSGSAHVDRATGRRVVKRSAGDGGNGNGDQPEHHGPGRLTPVRGKTGGIYKPNAAKNHPNTKPCAGRIARHCALPAAARHAQCADFDFAVLGSTPLARLFAGLLASAHGEARVSVRRKPIQLPPAPRRRSVGGAGYSPRDLGAARPAVPETLKLLSPHRRHGAWSRVDPVFFAEAPAGAEALAHVRHMALGLWPRRRAGSGDGLGAGREGLVLRDAVLLHRPGAGAGARSMAGPAGFAAWRRPRTLTIRTDGSAELRLRRGSHRDRRRPCWPTTPPSSAHMPPRNGRRCCRAGSPAPSSPNRPSRSPRRSCIGSIPG